MSYCVHCGVELDPTAAVCPLCETPVHDPKSPRDTTSPPPYPTRSSTVELPGKGELALLLTVLLCAVAAVCGVLNIFLKPGRLWSLYAIGALLTVWFWLILPIFQPKLHRAVKVLLDGAAVALYLFLISLDLHGRVWYLGLALPIVLAETAIVLGLALCLPRRSILSAITLVIGAVAASCLCIELFVDRFLTGAWQPLWSLVVFAACAAIMAVLIVVRRVPGLRAWARRQFHL